MADGPGDPTPREETPDTPDDDGMVLFFKVEERVKKVRFRGSSISELRALFFSKYKLAGWSMDNIGQMHVKDQVRAQSCLLLFRFSN